jgi:signal transduction histidine kinase
MYIAISDSGKGISISILSRLFEKFNIDSDVETRLRLYISKKLIEVMDGRIWTFNNTDGIDSTFLFSLPRSKL